MADNQDGGKEENKGASEPAISTEMEEATPIEPPHSDTTPSIRDMQTSDGGANHPIPNKQPSISEEIFIDRMKKSDLWMIRLTGGVVFLAVVSAMVSYCQLQEMIRSYAPVKESADAAKRSADIANESLVAVQRAFINVSELKQEAVSDKDGVIKFWRVTPVIKNTGNTPAEGVSIVVVTPGVEWIVRPQQFTRQAYSLLSAKIGAPRDPGEFIADPTARGALFFKSNFSIGPQGSISASAITSEITAQDGLDAKLIKLGASFMGLSAILTLSRVLTSPNFASA